MSEKPEVVFTVKHVLYVPILLLPRTLYVSQEFGTVQHLCPCGCGEQIMIPIQPSWEKGWAYEEENGEVTLSPSLQTNYHCKSHYFIRKNKVVWA